MAGSNRHYRVAKKAIEITKENGAFIPGCYKKKILVIGIIVMVLVFIKGLLIGTLIKHNR